MVLHEYPFTGCGARFRRSRGLPGGQGDPLPVPLEGDVNQLAAGHRLDRMRQDVDDLVHVVTLQHRHGHHQQLMEAGEGTPQVQLAGFRNGSG